MNKSIKIMCLDCRNGSLGESGKCTKCLRQFLLYQNTPICLPENSVIDEGSFKASPDTVHLRYLKFRKIFNLSNSVNLARSKVFKYIFENYSCDKILIVGAANQKVDIVKYFRGCDVTAIDIDASSEVDVYADAHSLPFFNDTFDLVICTAVLEHVVSPEIVVSEINRVLMSGGLSYSEFPFLQSVHEGAYDFYRASPTGHRLLFKNFKIIRFGLVAGPFTALSWQVEKILIMLCSFGSLRIEKPVKFIYRLLFFWIKYFDYAIKNRPGAYDAASCSFVLSEKNEQHIVTNREIILDHFGQNKFER